MRTCEEKRRVQVIQGVDSDRNPVLTVYQHVDNGTPCSHRILGELQPGDETKIDKVVPAIRMGKR